MQQSENINELAKALSAAQAEIEGAVKDSSNPFFKSKYADLASVIEAVKVPLAKHGLSVIQMTDIELDGDFCLTVQTQIMHSSGQWIRGRLPVKSKDDSPQAQGSGLSYARRYALMAALNVPALDDDAEQAQQAYRKPQAQQQGSRQPLPNFTAEELNKLSAEIQNVPAAVASEQTLEHIRTLIKNNPEFLPQIKKFMKKEFNVSDSKNLTQAQAEMILETFK